VAAVVLNTVLEEYESAFATRATFGMVMPSMLAPWERDSERPTLVSRWTRAPSASPSSIRICCCSLVRSKCARGDHHRRSIGEEVYPSVVFFQDTLQLNIERVYVAGLPKRRRRAGVEESVGRGGGGSHRRLANWRQQRHGPRWRMAGVVGALIS